MTGLVALLAQALYYGPTPADEALVRCREFLAEAAGDRSRLEAALQGTLGGLHAMRGDFEEARGLHARAVTTYEEIGHHFRRASRSLVGGEIEMLAGNAAAAEQELAHGCEILERMGERGLRSTLTAFLARALAAQERFDEAEERTRYREETAGADDLVTQVVWRSTRAVVLAHRGERPGPAESMAEEATALSADTDFLDLRASALAGLAEVLVLAGRDDDAAVAAESATATFERKGNVVAARRAAALVPDAKGLRLFSPGAETSIVAPATNWRWRNARSEERQEREEVGRQLESVQVVSIEAAIGDGYTWRSPTSRAR